MTLYRVKQFTHAKTKRQKAPTAINIKEQA
jgi:hypothetical protein